eukprot:6337365-Prymnesium_polylepis.1
MRPVRLAASQVAAVCGYHPFADPVEVFCDAVYQDLDLRDDDAAVLGLRVRSRDDETAEIIRVLAQSATGGAIAASVRTALSKPTTSVADVAAIGRQTTALAAAAASSGALPAASAAKLEQGLRSL